MEIRNNADHQAANQPAVKDVANCEISCETGISPWDNYLTGKKEPARRFLSKMAGKMKAGGLKLPDGKTRTRFAEALAADPKCVERAAQLLLESASCDESVRRVVFELVEAGIRHMDYLSFSEPLNADNYRRTISTWLGGLQKQKIRPSDMGIFRLLISFGWSRQLLDCDSAFRLIEMIVKPKPNKNRTKNDFSVENLQTPMDVLLSAAPTIPVYSSLYEFCALHKMVTENLNGQIRSQASHISRLVDEEKKSVAVITGLHDDISKLKVEWTESRSQVEKLEKRIVDIQDDYQHELDEQRGRIRGILQGQLSRWLQEAMGLLSFNPPGISGIQERLRDSLELIEKENRCLRPSD